MIKSKKMKNVVYGILGFLFFIISMPLFAGCSKDNNKLVIWAYDNYITAAKEAKELYEKENPNLKVQIVELGQDEMVEKFRIALASADKSTLPNIIIEEDYNIKGYLRFYQDYFVDVTESINTEDYVDYKISNVTYDDKIYGFPFDSGVGCFYYRKDLIEAAGYSETDMTDLTWEKVVEIGQALKEKTGKYMLPICPEGNIEGRVMLESTGNWYYDKEGNYYLDGNQALSDVATTMKLLYDSGVGYKVNGWDDIISSFYNGNVACVIGGNFWTSIIAENEEQAGLWRIAKVPKLTGNPDYTSYSACSGCAWYVLNKTHSNEAVDFVKNYLAENKDVINTLVEKIRLVPTYIPAFSVENMQVGDDYFGGQKICQIMAGWGEYVVSLNYGVYPYEMAYYHGELIADYINGTKTLQEIIEALKDKADELGN